MINVLVVGQTPPPVHGQAVMIDRMLRGNYQHVRLHHVRMAFSDSIDDVGRFRLGKVWQLISLVVRIVYGRFRHRAAVLYYPPAGPRKVPMYRDIAVLLLTRWLFARTVFHFHASGISQLYPRLSHPMRWLFRRALFQPDVAVRIANVGINDAELLQACRVMMVPNGIADESLPRNSSTAVSRQRGKNALAASASSYDDIHSAATAVLENAALRLLFVGMLCEGKGVLVLLEACRQLLARGVAFQLELMGNFRDVVFAEEFSRFVEDHGLATHVKLLGQCVGNEKWQAFARAEVFCFPSHYEAETFPTVVLEAMSAELPVVATRWRGIAEMVEEGRTGLLVDVRDSSALADVIERFALDEQLRCEFGSHGREKFLREFTSERFNARMEEAFLAAVG